MTARAVSFPESEANVGNLNESRQIPDGPAVLGMTILALSRSPTVLRSWGACFDYANKIKNCFRLASSEETYPSSLSLFLAGSKSGYFSRTLESVFLASSFLPCDICSTALL